MGIEYDEKGVYPVGRGYEIGLIRRTFKGLSSRIRMEVERKKHVTSELDLVRKGPTDLG